MNRRKLKHKEINGLYAPAAPKFTDQGMPNNGKSWIIICIKILAFVIMILGFILVINKFIHH